MKNELTKAVPVAFKEWSLICDALASGAQSLILRKGGIAEGRSGFSFDHDSFWFFPTQFHTQQNLVLENTRPEEATRYQQHTPEPGDELHLDLIATVVRKGRLKHWQDVKDLEGFHQWQERVLEERFHYGNPPGLHYALVRVYRTDQPLKLTMQRSFGGCRSWIDLPQDIDVLHSFYPVLSDDEFSQLQQRLENLKGW